MKFLCTNLHGETPFVVNNTRQGFHLRFKILKKYFLSILMLLILPHFINAQCTCSGNTGTLDWNTAVWPTTSLNENFDIVTAGSETVNMDINISTLSSGSFYTNTPAVDVLGGAINYFGTGADLGLIYDPTAGQGISTITYQITFDTPVTCLSFDISDLDISTGRRDSITVMSDAGDPTLTTVGANPTVQLFGDNSASATGTGGVNGNGSSDRDDNGSVLVDFGDLSITTVTILYHEVSGAPDPGIRGIGVLGQLSLCPPPLVSSISGSVMEDTNGDGIADAPVPAGTVIELLDEFGDPVLDESSNPITTTTAADGSYTFSGLLGGTYQVRENDPATFSSVSDTDSGDDNLTTVVLVAGNDVTGVDFIDERPVSISGTVLEDTDGDGIGDVPVPAGTVMELLDAMGDPVLDDMGVAITTTTDAAGAYSFDNISPGDYQVKENDPADFSSVSDTDSGDENNTSVSAAPGEDVVGIDFVDEMSGSISGVVLVDTDGDGIGDTPTPVKAVVTLLDDMGNPVLDDEGNPFVTTTSSIDGSYSFSDVPPGNYQVVETNPFGYSSVGDTDGGDPDDTGVVLGAGQNVENVDFVNEKTATISGTVLEDIDGDGVGDLPEPGLVVSLLYSDGTPVLDENGVAVETTTNTDGTYSFSDLSPGDYLVQTTDPAGFNSVGDTDGGDENQTSVNVVGTEDVTGIDFVDEQPGSISGTILEDIDGDGVGDTPVPAGITVTLLDENGDVLTSTTTDANGDYSFPNLSPGNYEVVASDPSGYGSVLDTDGGDPNSTSVTIQPGEDVSSIDFVDEQPVSISGTVWEDTNGDGIGDVPVPEGTVISLLDASGFAVYDENGVPITTTTAADGTYSFTDISPGVYTVIEINPVGYTSVSDVDGGKPDRVLVTASPGEAVTGIDFIDEQPGSISGTVLIDTDGDGVGDSPAPAGTVVSLLDGMGNPILDNSGNPVTTTTAADGSYSFTKIPPGDYQIAETDPANYGSVSDTDGGDSNVTSVTLNPAENITGIDFVDALGYVISGTIFNDGNGLTDNFINGMGISNPSSTQLYVTLFDDNNNYIADVPVNADGTYEFTDVIGGNYTVQLNDPGAAPSLPDGWENTGEYIGGTAGSDGAVDGQIAVTLSNTDITDVNFGIQVIPVADNLTEPEQSNPGSTAQVPVPALSGTDFEDGVKGAGDDVIIQTLPNDATLYYAGQPVTPGQVITSYNPSLLTIDPINGTVTSSFTYSFVDDAGGESDPATVVMPFLGSLPIELFDFTVNKDDRKAILKWATASEYNNDYFEIERSVDGIAFESLYKIKGNGTTTTTSYYNYTDKRTRGGHNYYRIKQVDHDRSFSYSDIKSVYFGHGTEINVYPNPTMGTVTIDNGTRVPFLLQVYSADGKLMKKLNSATLAEGQLIDISSFSAGYYYFKFIFENGTVESKQIQLLNNK